MTVEYKNKKVLVTGGTGMIGRQLVDLLVNRGANVYVVSLDPPKGLPESVKYLYADLTDFSACQDACSGMDYVFNLVGVKGSPKMCKEQPADFMVPMLQFNTNMMEWSKRMGELQAEAYKIQYGWDCVSIVRPANVYGPYDNFDPENAMVIPSLIRKSYENDKLEVWGDGSPIRDFIHSRDVALGMLHMVDNKINVPVNLGSGEGITIKQIVDIVVEKCPKETIDWFEKNRSTIDDRHNAFKK